MCGRIFGIEVSIDILAKMVCFRVWWRVKRVSLQQTLGGSCPTISFGRNVGKL